MHSKDYILIAQVLYRNKPVRSKVQLSTWRKIRDEFVETLSVSNLNFKKSKFIGYTEVGYVYRNGELVPHNYTAGILRDGKVVSRKKV